MLRRGEVVAHLRPRKAGAARCTVHGAGGWVVVGGGRLLGGEEGGAKVCVGRAWGSGCVCGWGVATGRGGVMMVQHAPAVA